MEVRGSFSDERHIRDPIEQRAIRTQQELAAVLRERGFRATPGDHQPRCRRARAWEGESRGPASLCPAAAPARRGGLSGEDRLPAPPLGRARRVSRRGPAPRESRTLPGSARSRRPALRSDQAGRRSSLDRQRRLHRLRRAAPIERPSAGARPPCWASPAGTDRAASRGLLTPLRARGRLRARTRLQHTRLQRAGLGFFSLFRGYRGTVNTKPTLQPARTASRSSATELEEMVSVRGPRSPSGS